MTRPWQVGRPPSKGEYLVIDSLYGHMHVAYWRSDLGWDIRGRWLGHDAVKCWQDLPARPLPVL